MTKQTVSNLFAGLFTLTLIGLGWHFVGRPVVQFVNDPIGFMEADNAKNHPTAAATPERVTVTELKPVSNPAVGPGDKVVITSGKYVFESREALQAYRTGARKLSKMLANGSAYQLTHYIRATVVLTYGADVKINQTPDAGDAGATWWIDIADAQ